MVTTFRKVRANGNLGVGTAREDVLASFGLGASTRRPEAKGVSGLLTEAFWELIQVPFRHADLIWGVVPLYFGWVVSELNSSKANYSTAIQTGFALLWSGAQWVWQSSLSNGGVKVAAGGWFPVNWGVTVVVVLLGALALWSGLRRQYPRGMRFLGQSRFAGYFMIAVFPIQAGHLAWSWPRAAAIVVFALPIWMLVNLVLWPLRRK